MRFNSRNTKYRIWNTVYSIRNTPRLCPGQAENGFTLLEVLISLIVFTVGIIIIIMAFTSGLFASSDVENVDLALNIAQAKMEEVKNTPFASLADSGPAPDPNFSNFNISVNVAEGQDPMQVDVTVSWNTKGGQSNIILTTLAANY